MNLIKKLILKYLNPLFIIAICLGCGYILISQLNSAMELNSTDFPYFSIIMLSMLISVLLHTVIHESGHLVFGLLSGYKFTSFRILSFMWVKDDGKIKFKRFSLAGTVGQCLMSPPDMIDGKMPVILYNLGGSIMNIVAGIIFALIYLLDIPLLSEIMLSVAIIGFITAIVNGIPMRTKTVDNDGYNAFALCQNKQALRAFWIQLKINEQTSKGKRLKDMPEEWFALPDDNLDNSMIATIGVFACNRLMDLHEFQSADELITKLLRSDYAIAAIHRNLLICDRIYCELIGKNDIETLNKLLTPNQAKFMSSMPSFPSILRTHYAHTLLSSKDYANANNIKAHFEKVAGTYPYICDIQAERELMEIAEKAALPNLKSDI